MSSRGQSLMKALAKYKGRLDKEHGVIPRKHQNIPREPELRGKFTKKSHGIGSGGIF